MAGAIIGTVEYMAPEQAKGLPVDQRADIYAFGLILYDMLIGGRRSERAESAIAELQRRMEKAPPAPRTRQSRDPASPSTRSSAAASSRTPTSDSRRRSICSPRWTGWTSNGKPLPIIRRAHATDDGGGCRAGPAAARRHLLRDEMAVGAGERPDPVSVVIADVQNNTGDPTFDNSIAQTLRRALEDASFISAYDRSKMPSLGVRDAREAGRGRRPRAGRQAGSGSRPGRFDRAISRRL